MARMFLSLPPPPLSLLVHFVEVFAQRISMEGGEGQIKASLALRRSVSFDLAFETFSTGQ